MPSPSLNTEPLSLAAPPFQFAADEPAWEDDFLALLRLQPGEAPGLGEANARTLCNTLFQLERSFEQLKGNTDLAADRKLRNLSTAIAKLKPALAAAEATYVNVEGSLVTPQRTDIEIAGTPEERVGLTASVVTLCEYPAVYVRGRLVQRARCLIAVPPSASLAS